MVFRTEHNDCLWHDVAVVALLLLLPPRIQVAVKRTLAAGKGSGVRHLNNFTAAGGKPVADPEDDKLWLSLESKHTLLEFDFARTWQQVGCVHTCWRM